MRKHQGVELSFHYSRNLNSDMHVALEGKINVFVRCYWVKGNASATYSIYAVYMYNVYELFSSRNRFAATYMYI